MHVPALADAARLKSLDELRSSLYSSADVMDFKEKSESQCMSVRTSPMKSKYPSLLSVSILVEQSWRNIRLRTAGSPSSS